MLPLSYSPLSVRITFTLFLYKAIEERSTKNDLKEYSIFVWKLGFEALNNAKNTSVYFFPARFVVIEFDSHIRSSVMHNLME